MKKWSKLSGFTLAEVLIIAPIVILVIGTFVVFIINITGEVIKTKAAIDTVGDTQNALRYIQSDIRLSTGFADTTGTVTTPQGSGNDAAAWTNSGTSSTNLILTRIATTYSPINPNSLIVYTNSPFNCTVGNREQNTAYTYYSVYFVSGGSLWQRNILKNYPTVLTSLCSTPWQLPSCTLANVTAVPAICKVQDTEVATNVSSFTVQYYRADSSGNAVATSTRSDATNVKITLNTSKAAAGKTLTSSDELRAAKRGSDLPAIVQTSNPATWTACPMSNSWTTYTGYPTLAYTKTSTGTVMMSGFFMKTAAPVADETMCTLPSGYRPTKRLIFQAAGGGGAARVDVLTTGEVRYETGGGPSPSWVSAGNISFLASDVAPIGNWTNLTAYPGSGWVSYDGGTSFAIPAVTKDSSGRAWVQGLAKSGITTSGSGAYTLPTGYPINTYECLIYPAMTNPNVAGSMSPQGSNITFRYGSNGYWSLQAMYYPDGAIQWTTPPLQNGWTAYAAGCWGSAAYVKNADNIVSLKGLIKSGATSGTILTLPVGYRPARTDVYCAVNSYNAGTDGHAALWILPSGNVDISSGVSSTWLSLSGCNFVAEQ